VVGGDRFYLKFWVKGPRWSEIGINVYLQRSSNTWWRLKTGKQNTICCITTILLVMNIWWEEWTSCNYITEYTVCIVSLRHTWHCSQTSNAHNSTQISYVITTNKMPAATVTYPHVTVAV